MTKLWPKTKLTLIISNIIIYTGIFLFSILALIIGLIVLGIYKIKPTLYWRKVIHYLSHLYGRIFLWIIKPWVPVIIPNPEILHKLAPCVIIANHQSILDLFLFAAQKETNFSYVMKAWPLKIFFYAPFMRALDYVVVENKSLADIEEECFELLKDGISVVFFPEGTRSRDGQIGKFKSGAFSLALKANVPIVPLFFENSGQVLPVGSLLFHPKPLKMRFLEPLFTDDFQHDPLAHRTLQKKARSLYQAATAKRDASNLKAS